MTQFIAGQRVLALKSEQSIKSGNVYLVKESKTMETLIGERTILTLMAVGKECERSNRAVRHVAVVPGLLQLASWRSGVRS